MDIQIWFQFIKIYHCSFTVTYHARKIMWDIGYHQFLQSILVSIPSVDDVRSQSQSQNAYLRESEKTKWHDHEKELFIFGKKTCILYFRDQRKSQSMFLVFSRMFILVVNLGLVLAKPMHERKTRYCYKPIIVIVSLLLF